MFIPLLRCGTTKRSAKRCGWLLFVLLFCFGTSLSAQKSGQDTLGVNLRQAEKLFLDNNLQLIAQKYNIDASYAGVVQARLYPNPNASVMNGLYSGSEKKFIFLKGEETAAGLSQMIILAGKRNKQIKIAEANVTLSEYQFFDLLRTLKFTLRTDFFNIYYLRQSAKAYELEMKALRQIVDAFGKQEGQGYISAKEVVRIQAQLYTFQAEYTGLQSQINDLQSELRLLLQVKPNVYLNPLPDTTAISKLNPLQYPVTALLDSAYHNRTDLLIAKTNTEINKLQYKYQKSLRVPDLSLNISYDQAGGFQNNFVGVGAAMDLPFFNRNQGNVKMAKIMIDNTIALEKSTEATVEENVNHALQNAVMQNTFLGTIQPSFFGNFENLMHQVLVNYQSRNISILDFLDFYDSYKQNILQINAIRYNRVQAFEEINFYTATNFFN